jgi:NADH-quinone oxidoreductase chain G
MIKVTINGQEFLVKSNLSILEACKYVGFVIPRFCYHETLSVAGNCRMCLVEVVNTPKPIASCATPLMNNMKILVDSPLVKKARENVLEALLANHPLDCPICDQAGECDLQDQTKVFGGNFSKFFFSKRGVEDKYCGPLIKTIMTRCIHCTRCVRFNSEIAGVEYLGTLNRGGVTEIGGYLSNSFNSEISGNVIDLCPVGALTAKPYSFKARPWELKIGESIDFTDSLGSNLFVNFKESEVVRVLPKINKNINDSIISDKARFSYDSFKNQRAQKIFLKSNTGRFTKTNWLSLLEDIESLISSKKITFIVDEELDFKSLSLLKNLSYKFKNIKIKSKTISSNSSNLFIGGLSNKISDLNLDSKVCFLISTNIRSESAILNSKLRLKFVSSDLSVFSLNQNFKSNFAINFINLNITGFLKFLEAKNPLLSKFALNSKNPIFLIGSNILSRGFFINDLIKQIKIINNSSVLININSFSNSSGLSFFNVKPFNNSDLSESDAVFLIDLDNTTSISTIFSKFSGKKFWFNSHGSLLASKSDCIIPVSSFLEEEKILLNLEQRPQKSLKILSSLGDSRSLSQLFSVFLEFRTKKQGNFIANNFIYEMTEALSLFNSLNNSLTSAFLKSNSYSNFSVSNYPFKSSLEDFYRSNKITKNSIVMSKCSQEFRKLSTNFNKIFI